MQRNTNEEITLGFYGPLKMSKPYNGFLDKNCKIRFSNLSMISYSIKDDSYLYEFAKIIKKLNIKDKNGIVLSLQNYINSFFGKYCGTDLREDFFNSRLQSKLTDEEYFEELESFDLSDLRGKGYAMCTECSAMAQNILSLFDFNSYYCLGHMQYNDQVEEHCYNIAQVTNGYRIVDFSVPVLQYNQIHERVLPYFANMSNEDFDQFLNGNFCKKFANYEIEVIDGKSIKHSLLDRVYTNGPVPEISKKL